MAYVLEPIVNTSTPLAPSRFGASPAAFSILAVAVMSVGSLMSIIWTPSSTLPATMAYVLEPIVNVSTSDAPLSSSEPVSSILSVAEISEGVAANDPDGNWKRSEDAANNRMNN